MCAERTLNPNMDVVLRLLGLPLVFVGFGEGVCERDLLAWRTMEAAQTDRYEHHVASNMAKGVAVRISCAFDAGLLHSHG